MKIEDMNMGSDFHENSNFESGQVSSRTMNKEERDLFARLKRRNEKLQEEN